MKTRLSSCTEAHRVYKLTNLVYRLHSKLYLHVCMFA